MPEIERLLIVADDLTGAADTAARCRQAGLPASIFLRPPRPPFPTGAISVTTDSRHLSPADAAKAVRAGIEGLAGLRHARWYKKIDSTLRGNIGAELDAMLDALDSGTAQPCAVISPAFPAQDRGLCDGYLVHDTVEPRSLSLPALLAEQSRRAGALIDLAAVRGDALAAAIESVHARGVSLLVVDAMTEADLERIANVAGRVVPHALFCGSAGLAGVLAAGIAMPAAAETPEFDAHDARRPGSVLTVVGSGSEMARAQINALRAQRGVNSVEIGEDGEERAATWASGEARAWLLCLPEPAPGALLDGPHARRLAMLLAERAMAIIRDVRPDAIILGGGDTAIHVLERLDVQRLDVIAELLPGMPLTRVIAGGGYAPLVVLKAGNHGDRESLIVLVEGSKSIMDSE